MAPQAHAMAALNDVLALTAFGELRSLYVPMPGHCPDVELRYPPVVHVRGTPAIATRSAAKGVWPRMHAVLPLRPLPPTL